MRSWPHDLTPLSECAFVISAAVSNPESAPIRGVILTFIDSDHEHHNFFIYDLVDQSVACGKTNNHNEHHKLIIDDVILAR